MAGTTEPGNAKATLHEEKDPSSRLEFGLNPTQVSFSRSVKFERKAKQAPGEPTTQFLGVDPTTLQLALLLDGVGVRDNEVQGQLDQLVGWTSVPDDAQSSSSSPPRLVFSWGSLAISGATTFVGYLEQLKVTIEMFTRTGVPLRASVSLTLKSDEAEPRGTNPTSGAERSRRRRVVERGVTLQRLAFEEYGDPGAWRAVAELNGIDDPTRLRTGTEVLLPDPVELRAVLP